MLVNLSKMATITKKNTIYADVKATNDISDVTISSYIEALENMVLRDLLSYAQAQNARVMHYRDDMGLEIDAIYQLPDGRYALIEIKTGENAVAKAEAGFLKFKELIRKHNDEVLSNKEHPGVTYREPSVLIIICANATMAYTTKNGVKVVPIGCVRN